MIVRERDSVCMKERGKETESIFQRERHSVVVRDRECDYKREKETVFKE